MKNKKDLSPEAIAKLLESVPAEDCKDYLIQLHDELGLKHNDAAHDLRINKRIIDNYVGELGEIDNLTKRQEIIIKIFYCKYLIEAHLGLAEISKLILGLQRLLKIDKMFPEDCKTLEKIYSSRQIMIESFGQELIELLKEEADGK
jgi:hypothetical protein